MFCFAEFGQQDENLQRHADDPNFSITQTLGLYATPPPEDIVAIRMDVASDFVILGFGGGLGFGLGFGEILD